MTSAVFSCLFVRFYKKVDRALGRRLNIGRNRRVWLSLLVLTLGLLNACSLSFFFDGVGDGLPPPTTKVHRDLQREIETLERQLTEMEMSLARAQAGEQDAEEQPLLAELAGSWPEAADVLPLDYAGNVNWVQALADGSLEPWSGFERDTPEQAIFDFDVPFADSEDEIYHLNFPHAAHTQWLTCKNCHPAIFPLSRDGNKPRTVITMAAIKAGKYCGECHGNVAFSVNRSCARCHDGLPRQADWQPSEEPRTPIENAGAWSEALAMLPFNESHVDWSKALVDGIIDPRAAIDPTAPDQAFFPLNVERIPAAGPMFKVVYPHAAHTAVLSCGSCHPGIFEMRAGANAISMSTILAGDHCGRCHGKVAFPVATGCPRCHVALAGSKT